MTAHHKRSFARSRVQPTVDGILIYIRDFIKDGNIDGSLVGVFRCAA